MQSQCVKPLLKWCDINIAIVSIQRSDVLVFSFFSIGDTPEVSATCTDEALRIVLEDDVQHFVNLLNGHLQWSTFVASADRFRHRWKSVPECQALCCILASRILLCWFHVKAAWHDSLLTKVSLVKCDAFNLFHIDCGRIELVYC